VFGDIPPSDAVRDAWQQWNTDRRRLGRTLAPRQWGRACRQCKFPGACRWVSHPGVQRLSFHQPPGIAAYSPGTVAATQRL
jgi:hypothetical protein